MSDPISPSGPAPAEDAIPQPTTQRGIWRVDDIIVARQRVAEFPAVCVRCGSTDRCRAIRYNIRRKPSTLYLLFPNVAPFSKAVTVKPQLCAEHYKKEVISRWIGHALLAIALAMVVVPFFLIGETDESKGYLFIVPYGILLIQVWVYYRTFRHKVLVASEIRGNDAVIRAIPEPLQDALPLVAAAG